MTISAIPLEYSQHYLTLKYLVKLRSITQNRMIKHIVPEVCKLIGRTTPTYYLWARSEKPVEIPEDIQEKLAEYFGVPKEHLFTNNFKVMA